MYLKVLSISIILFFCFDNLNLLSQEKNEIDSLLKLLETAEHDTVKAALYYKLADIKLYSDKDTSEIYASKALSLSLKNNYSTGIANSYLIISRKHNVEGNYKESVDYSHKALNIYSAEKDTIGLIESYSLLGLTNFYLETKDKAVEFLNLALKLSKKIGKEDTQKIYNNLGLLFLGSKKRDSALYYFEKSILISTEFNDKTGIIYGYGNLANIYTADEKFDKALQIYQKIEELCKELKNKDCLTLSYTNKAMVYSKLAKKTKNKEEQRKFLETAAENAKNALNISKEINSLPQINFNNYQLAFIYKDLNNYKQAFEYAEEFIKINDSIFNIEKVKEIEILQKNFKTESQKLKINNITKEQEIKDSIIKKLNIALYTATFAIIIVLFLVVLLFILYRKKKTANIQLNEKNEAIQNQSGEISSQRDNLSELAFELKKINKTKDKYFSVLAHDLKNPFQSILGFSELLKKDINANDYSKIETYADFIHVTGRKTYALLENLLDWARLQRGALKYQPEQYNLLNIINEPVEINRGAANSKEINIFNKVDPDEKIYVDKYMFSTVIRNLISNAIKFTNKGGVITITSEKTGKNLINVLVSDTGVGIKEDDLTRIFKLERGSSLKGTGKETGTGLGLLVCKEFTEKNHGNISVETQIGKGSTFTVTLPINPED